MLTMSRSEFSTRDTKSILGILATLIYTLGIHSDGMPVQYEAQNQTSDSGAPYCALCDPTQY